MDDVLAVFFFFVPSALVSHVFVAALGQLGNLGRDSRVTLG